MTDEEYRSLVDSARERCGKKGIDEALERNVVDVILGPGDGPLFAISGTAGKCDSNHLAATLPQH
jgi:amidase